MNPADRDPPRYATMNPSPARAVDEVENPFMKPTWTRDDLFLAFVLAQSSSGRFGKEAIEKARSTLHAYEDAMSDRAAAKVPQ